MQPCKGLAPPRLSLVSRVPWGGGGREGQVVGGLLPVPPTDLLPQAPHEAVTGLQAPGQSWAHRGPSALLPFLLPLHPCKTRHSQEDQLKDPKAIVLLLYKH